MQLKITVSGITITETLENRPDFPGLLSISDSLKKWKSDNIALDVDEEKFADILVPFIAHMRNGNFVPAKKIENNKVRYVGASGIKN